MTVQTMQHHENSVLMLLSRWRLPLLFLMLLTSCSAQSTYYVTPTPDTPCPGEPCHTLSEYVASQYFSSLPVNTTMEFLPGNHTLEQTISVTNLTWLTLHGDSSSFPEVISRIECTWPAGFVFTDITELYINALAYTSCGHHNSAAVHILTIKHSNISYCSFYNSANADSYGGALYIQNSYVILTVNKFQHNTAEVGGALTVESSTLNLTRNTFHNNSAQDGGAICILNTHNSIITENTFQNNSADVGGALYVDECTLNLTENTFHYNSADSAGGAVCVLQSTLNLTENAFQNNYANYGSGGAVYVQYGTLNLTENEFQNNAADSDGGAVCVLQNTLDLTENTFQNNSANHGGAVFVEYGTLNLTENKFQNNSADSNGGSVCVLQSTLNFTENTFQNNSAYYGGAVYAEYSTLNLTENEFQNNSANSNGGSVCVLNSTLNLTENTFQNNSATHGGAVYVEYGTLNLTENEFQNNSADFTGGAVCVLYSTLNLTENTFQYNSVNYRFGGAVYVEYATLNLTENTFQNNSANYGGAVYVQYGTLNLTENEFHNNSADSHGGAICVLNSTLNLTENTFQNNSANYGSGGAVYVQCGTLNLTENEFQNNAADSDGGAVCILNSTLNLAENTFQNNSANYGGAVYVQYGTLNLTENEFHNNSADSNGGAVNSVKYPFGGAVYVEYATLNLTENTFQNNSADYGFGGAVYVRYGTLNLTENEFQNNAAHFAGGAVCVVYSTLNLTENTFQNNSAVHSGGVQYTLSSILYYLGNKFQNNYAALGGSLNIASSNVTFTDDSFTVNYAQFGGAILSNGNTIAKMYNITIANNRAQYGGGMAAVDSQLEVLESTFENNRASYGGGLYVHNTELVGNTMFTKNSVTEGGGGIYASASSFTLTANTTMIVDNSAVHGGGLMLSGDSQLFLQAGIAIHFISNSAMSTGGAIKVKESNTLTYCIPSVNERLYLIHSECFFQIQHLNSSHNIFDLNHTMCFTNNSAVEAGTDLYGGSIDSCYSTLNDFIEFDVPIASGNVFDAITSCESKPAISSDPLNICTCSDGVTNCTGSYHPEPVYPGETLEVPVIALGQRNGTTIAVIQVTDTSKTTLNSLEYSQNINNSCNTLKYTIQSWAIDTTQEMTLYAQGPCSPTQTNTLTVIVKIKNCPPGFQLSMDQPICICAERLQHFTNTCLVDSTTVLRERNAEFWVGYDSSNESRGLILHPHCPFDYCTSEETYLAVDDSDKQCNYNRSGLLCGRCSENLSLALGSSRCLQCSNSYLSLLAVFTFAGIALVLLLLVLRLTVATGTINGLVFYANIVGVNSAVFFQPQITTVPTGLIANVLSVFIAWLNLDLGIETCFYNGMDAYVKTWMQFTFPLYVWVLVGMIIVGSHYSGRVASVFGRNPIAVLATLFLLSYAKLLRTITAVLSYTSLEYPNNEIGMWLFDGNIRYLSGKHIPLFIAAMVCLILLFLPYTILLVFGQWFQAKSHLKIFSLINNHYVKPFLDAYHAPYTNKHRYWTGLMLLLRFILFLISAVNVLGDPSVNLLAIASSCVAVLIYPTILSCRMYKTWRLGLLETSFITNLTILAVATLYIHLTGGSQNAVTFTSVGIAFATFTGIVICHSVQQIKGTRLWRRVCLQHDSIRVPLVDTDTGPEDPPDYVLMARSAPTCTVVDMRELREPCMATD